MVNDASWLANVDDNAEEPTLKYWAPLYLFVNMMLAKTHHAQEKLLIVDFEGKDVP